MTGGCQVPSQYRVLYVDDEPDLLDLGKMFLENNGNFSINTLPSAIVALDHLKSVPYDAIISDYQMPDMDGITLLKHLRSEGDATPFIIFTGKGREDVVIEALNSGADFYLQKGGDPEPLFAELEHKLLHAISRKKGDLALKRSERDYRNLIDHANEAIFVIQDERLRMVNPRTVALSGYPEFDLLNQPFARFVHPDDAGLLLERFRLWAAEGGNLSRYTFRIIRRDKVIRWVELNIVSITWDDRPAILNFMTDITDRKKTEDALRESEERYRQFFKTSLDSVFITTPEGRLVDCNDTLMDTFGFRDMEETFGADLVSMYVYPEERGILMELLKRDGGVKEYPLQFRRSDGTVFDSVVSVVSRKNPDGSIRMLIGTVHNITDRKQTEDALRDCEAKFHSFVDHTLEAVLVIDPQGEILFLNRAAARLVESESAGNLVGRNIMDFIAPESREEYLRDVGQASRGISTFLSRYDLISMKGKRIPVESAGKAITYEGKNADFVSLRSISRLN